MMKDLAEWSRDVPWSTMLSGVADKVKFALLSSLVVLSLIIMLAGCFISWGGRGVQKVAIVPIIVLNWFL